MNKTLSNAVKSAVENFPFTDFEKRLKEAKKIAGNTFSDYQYKKELKLQLSRLELLKTISKGYSVSEEQSCFVCHDLIGYMIQESEDRSNIICNKCKSMVDQIREGRL